MLVNQFIECSICQTIINLRIQAGYYNIPFNIYCPNCKTLLFGNVIFSQETINIALEINNAKKIDVDIRKDSEQYAVELSSELLTRKLYKTKFNLDEYEGTPYSRSVGFFNNLQEAKDVYNRSIHFALDIHESWNNIKNYYNLFSHKNYKLLYPLLNQEITRNPYTPIKKVETPLQAFIVLHHLFLFSTELSRILPAKKLNEYMDISNIIRQKKYFSEINKLSIFLTPKLDRIERKAFDLISQYIQIFEQLIPIVVLKNTNSLKNVDKDKYGIMTANYEKLSKFYAESFEWILENIIIVIALNNVVNREDYEKCINNVSFDTLLKKISKYNMLKYIEEGAPFSIPTKSLKNHMRNAIQHFDTEIDYISQEIIFSDSHNGKINQEIMYFIDLADLCIENFLIIIYILELTYQLRKPSLFQDLLSK